MKMYDFVLAWIRLCIGLAIAATDIIETDVVIIGGGSGGTYAAIRLHQMGVKVALIEREDRLGGHVNTYEDPTSGSTYDYGVQLFSNTTSVSNYFKYLNIPLEAVPSSGGSISKKVNFETGDIVPDSELIGGNLTAALLAYSDQQAKFSTIFDTWNLPDPVPEELLMPFGDFLEKHDLSALAYTSFQYNQGIGNLLAQPTVYVMKYQDPLQVHDLLHGGFVRNALGDNQKLYNNAHSTLGSRVYLGSKVEHIHRQNHCVDVHFSSPSGQKRINASKLLIAIPPKSSNLGFLDLDDSDGYLLSQFNNSYYWDMVIKNTGLLDDTSTLNVNPNSPFNLPVMPGLYSFVATPIKGVHAAYYSSPYPMSDDEVRTKTIATLARIRAGLGYPEPSGDPEFVGFHDHSPFELTASSQTIRNGFYRKFMALQGKQRTFWTGAAWISQGSSLVWEFTENQILPHLIS